jgi:hypothetical protein
MYRKEKGKFETYKDYLEWVIKEYKTRLDVARKARAYFRNVYI